MSTNECYWDMYHIDVLISHAHKCFVNKNLYHCILFRVKNQCKKLV